MSASHLRRRWGQFPNAVQFAHSLPRETVFLSPSLFALEIISDQAEISEEDKNTVSVRHRGGRGAIIEVVLGFAPGSAD